MDLAKLSQFSLSQEDINILLDENSMNDSTIEHSNIPDSILESDRKRTQRQKVRRPLAIPSLKNANAKEQKSLSTENSHQLEREKYLHELSIMHSRLEDQQKLNQTLQVKIDALSRKPALTHANKDENAQIQILKSNLYNILPSDIQYVQLSAVPEDKRTLLDAVRCRVYEEVNSLKLELFDLRRKGDTFGTIDRENEALRLRQKALEDDLKYKNGKCSELEGKLRVLEHEKKTQNEQFEDYKRRNMVVEDTISRIDGLTQNIALCERRLEEAEQEKESLLKAERELQKDKEDLLRQLDIFKLDKMYLSKEVQVLSDRCNGLDDKLVLRMKELEKAKEEQLHHFQNILSQTEKQRNDYETRLQKELESVRSRTTVDLDEIKRNSKDIYEREIQRLKDSLAVLRDEHRVNLASLDRLKHTHDELKHDAMVDKSKFESEISSLQQQLKMKSFEADRLKVIYEDSIHSLQRAQFEVEKCEKKIEILSRQLNQVQSDSTARISELELLASSRLQKLQILGGEDVVVAPDRESRKYEATFRDVRVTLDEYKAQNLKLRAEVELLEDLLSKSRQPVSAFVDAIREKESKLTKLQDEYSQISGDFKNMEVELGDLRKERSKLLLDLDKMKQNRQQMIQLRQLISDIIQKKPLRTQDMNFLRNP